MSKQGFGLGRGLSALIPQRTPTPSPASSRASASQEENRSSVTDTGASGSARMILVSDIYPNTHQPRKNFSQTELEELSSSIRKYGILQPVVVIERAQGGYELVAGERRWRAAKLVPLSTIPAMVRTAGELEKFELSLIENIQRQDLNPIEKADAYRRLVDEFDLTQEEAAKRLSISRSVLANTLRFLDLPGVIQSALASGTLSEGHAKIIASLPTEAEQLRAFETIQQDSLTVREAEHYVKQKKNDQKPSLGGIAPTVSLEEGETIRQLRQRLGTKVVVEARGAKGRIAIEFYSAEERAAILGQLRRLLSNLS